jgi:hypothetical protein
MSKKEIPKEGLPKSGKVPKTVYLTEGVARRLERVALEGGLSVSAYVEQNLRTRFKRGMTDSAKLSLIYQATFESKSLDTRLLARQRQILLDATYRVSEIVENNELDPPAKLDAIKKCVASALENDRRQAQPVEVSDLDDYPFDE